MVQYIHTPWRDRAELLKVRRQFYSSPPPNTATANNTTTNIILCDQQTEASQLHAVSQVSVWMLRGSCPHMVESTGLLMAAILADLDETRTRPDSSSSAVRLAYSAAFSRFVTGLLDSHQDKQQKQSMYSVAKTIGLPATFVELRHQCIHEQLPSLFKLRSAAHKSLAWIWDYYWKHLSGDEVSHEKGSSSNGAVPLQKILSSYFEANNAAREKALEARLMQQWDEAMILQALAEFGDTAEAPALLLRSLQLSRRIIEGDLQTSKFVNADKVLPKSRDLDATNAEIFQAQDTLEGLGSAQKTQAAAKNTETTAQTKGWSRYQGQWKPKPIGVV